MWLIRIHLRAFRNHNDTALEFGGGTNIILGDNGHGKTNIVEAISYLCLTKSFYASSDAVVPGLGKGAFEVDGIFLSDAHVETSVRVVYELESKEKVYAVNDRPIEPFSSIIGRFPVVILSPEHSPITLGPPRERRTFVDLVISQASASYFENVLEYRRILRQRNKILFDARTSRSDPFPLLAPWDEHLITVGSRLMQRRKIFVDEFESYVVSSYHRVTDDAEEPRIAYVAAVDLHDRSGEAEIADLLRQELARRRREEFQMGTTLVGPHRDEFAMTINGLDLRKYASQGQHKTFLIALKIGEFFYLKERCRETPIVLFDDVFSELDERRTKRVLSFVGELSQTFVTATAPGILDDAMTLGERNRKFFVANGTVIYENV